MDNDQEKKEQKKALLGFAWKSLPPITKLKIIGVIAAVVVGLLLLVIVIASISSIFLDYSNAAQGSDDITAEYEEFWGDLCKEGDKNCSPEHIEEAKKIKESQTKFFKKLDSLSKKYSLTDEQKYIVLSTIFYGYDINEFTEGNGAFSVDEDDEIDYENPTVKEEEGKIIYERELDSLKELIKQFKVNTAYCKKVRYAEGSNEPITETHLLYSSDNKTFSFNFFESAFFGIRKYPNKEGFQEARELCEQSGGSTFLQSSTDSQSSIDGLYRYLTESDYFDKKLHLRGEYKSYADSHSLSKDITTWAEEDLIAVRERIVEDIKLIVEEYMKNKEDSGSFIAKSGSSYWWPIGSVTTETDEEGRLFAADDPEFTHINSHYGIRIHPISGVKKLHNGIDLKGTFNSTNISASLDGTVIDANNTCVSRSDMNNKSHTRCGGGYGNYVKIQDVKGNIHIYAHMYRDSLKVSKGDKVSQGQVLGIIGSSGSSSGPHLHFTLIINGASVDPIDYIDPENPRPTSSIDFNKTRYSKEEFVAKVKDYYSSDKACNFSSTQAKNGCSSFRDEILNHDGALTIYETASKKNVNPELVIARSMVEGYSPGTNYNYFGYRCFNTGGIAACSKFTSFESSMDTFFNNISSRYDSVESMMSKYAFLGQYWYTGVHWGWGGCAYAKYIYPDGIPDRVTKACAHEDGYCSINNTANCEETTEEDRMAYTNYQVRKMANMIALVFG